MLTEREKRIVEMREKEGKTFREIANEFGFNTARANYLYNRASRKIDYANKYPDDPNKIEFERYAGKHLNANCFKAIKRYSIRTYSQAVSMTDDYIKSISNVSNTIFEELVVFRNELQEKLSIRRDDTLYTRLDDEDLLDEQEKLLEMAQRLSTHIKRLPHFNSSGNYKIISKIEHEVKIPSDQALKILKYLRDNEFKASLNYNQDTYSMIIIVELKNCGGEL